MRIKLKLLIALFATAAAACAQGVTGGSSSGGGGGGSATVNGQTCGTCNINQGAASGTLALNEGGGSPLGAAVADTNFGAAPGAVTVTQGILAGTYTSGITATGSATQTCNLALGSGATATVALTGTNAIAGGTALVITAAGTNTIVPTTATVSNGTATCSGTAVVAITSVSNTYGSLANVNVIELTLGATVASSSNPTGMAANKIYQIVTAQNSVGGYGDSLPSLFQNFPTLCPDANSLNLTLAWYTGSVFQPLGANNTSGHGCVTLGSAPASAPTVNTIGYPYYSLADQDFEMLIFGGGKVAGFLTGVDANPVTGQVTNLSHVINNSLQHSGIASTAVTPGSYTNANLTVAADGSITAASNGSGGSGTGCVPGGTSGQALIDSGSGSCTDVANPAAAKVFAGPTSGGAAAPTFRALAATDEVPIVLNAPTVGSSDTITCSTSYQAFASTVTWPSFTQTPGAAWRLHWWFQSTTNSTGTTEALKLVFGSSFAAGTPIFTQTPSFGAASQTNMVTEAVWDIAATVIGSTGTIATALTDLALAPNTAVLANLTAPVSTFDTTSAHTLYLGLLCGSASGWAVTSLNAFIERLY